VTAKAYRRAALIGRGRITIKITIMITIKEGGEGRVKNGEAARTSKIQLPTLNIERESCES
jgi:hypothetical protein